MDNRLKKRLTVDVQYIATVSRDSYGDEVTAPPVDMKAYKHGKVTNVTDLQGLETVSNQQLIIDGKWFFNHGDSFKVLGKLFPVKAFSSFEGLKENRGTTVVYI